MVAGDDNAERHAAGAHWVERRRAKHIAPMIVDFAFDTGCAGRIGRYFIYNPWEVNKAWFACYPVRSDVEAVEQYIHNAPRHRNLFNELFHEALRG